MTAQVMHPARVTRGPAARPRRVPRSLWVPLSIFLAARAFSAGVMAWASRFQIATAPVAGDPTQTYFVHSPLPADPGYLGLVTNWDGQWYRFIADLGYLPASLDHSAAAGWAWAFPPGYPMLLRTLSHLLGVDVSGSGFPVLASVVSTLLGAIGMVLLYRLVSDQAGDLNACAAVATTSCFLAAPLFQSAYSESLAFALLTASLLLVARARFWWASLSILGLALTRLITPGLAVVCVAAVLVRHRTDPGSLRRRDWIGCAVATLLSLVGVLIWPTLAGLLGGGSGAERVQMMTRVPLGWFSAFYSYSPGALAVPLLVALILTLVVWHKRAEWGPVLSAWALAYPLFLLVVTPPLTGIVRYLLLAFPLGLLSTGSRDFSPRARRTSLVLWVAALLVMQVLWIRYSFVYDGTPIMP